jgi:hypothetical protein
MGWLPRASIECVDRMLVFMSPISIVTGYQQMFDFVTTASMAGSGEKLGTEPWIGQLACCELCRDLFSQEQWPCSTLLLTVQKVTICGPRETRMVDGHTRTEHGKRVTCWSSFPLQGVYRFESP